MNAWAAPVAAGPLDARVCLPGSKSVAARALVLAALADGPGTLRGVLRSRDTDLMRAGLVALGAVVEDLGAGDVRVQPIGTVKPGAVIDCGLSGTVMRFLPPVATLAHGVTSFIGDPAASDRPMEPLLGALAGLGATVTGTRLPFTITGLARPVGGTARLDASGSSQFVSGLLLAGARFEAGLLVANTGPGLVSVPHIEMTLAMLRARGADAVRLDERRWRVSPGPIAATDERIEPDLTNTATFLAAALAAGGRVRAPWPSATVQPADELLDVLRAFGADVTVGADEVEVSGVELRGVDVDLGAVSEFTPVAAALAALADGPSRLRGVGHVRGHETDRLAALETELRALGADVAQTEDGLAIVPAKLRSVRPFTTYGDHRMAHAGALIGLAVPGVVLDDVGVTTKTLPDFPELWRRLVGGGE